MPPKNMISVSRKTHIPSVEDSNCCSLSSKWCLSAVEACEATLRSVSANFHLLGIIVRPLGHHRRHVKIESRRRRGGLLPFQSLGLPRILRRSLAFAPSPAQINQRQQVADAQNRGARGGKHVQHLKLLRVGRITARHPQIAQDELREKRQIESDKDNRRRQPRPHLRIKPPGHLREPEMDPAQKR